MTIKTNNDKCSCIEHNNGGEKVIIVNGCPIHDELFGHNAKIEPVPNNEWEKELREKTWLKPMSIDELVKYINSLLSSERQRLGREIDWILSPHEYESDSPLMEKFALKLKEKYKKNILKLLE